MTTVYLKGKYAPGGQDWIQGVSTQHTGEGIWIWTNHNSKPLFFPWPSVERVG